MSGSGKEARHADNGKCSGVGLNAEEIEATCSANIAADWRNEEALLLNVVDELCLSGRVSRWLEAFQRAYGVNQQLEVLALVGNYHTISFVANTADLAPEAFAARFPETVRQA